MTFTTLVKQEENKTLYIHGNLTLEELNEHKSDGWFYYKGDKIERKGHYKAVRKS